MTDPSRSMYKPVSLSTTHPFDPDRALAFRVGLRLEALRSRAGASRRIASKAAVVMAIADHRKLLGGC